MPEIPELVFPLLNNLNFTLSHNGIAAMQFLDIIAVQKNVHFSSNKLHTSKQ
jgi:hypothetical protein